jgi:hypothetical protein
MAQQPTYPADYDFDGRIAALEAEIASIRKTSHQPTVPISISQPTVPYRNAQDTADISPTNSFITKRNYSNTDYTQFQPTDVLISTHLPITNKLPTPAEISPFNIDHSSDDAENINNNSTDKAKFYTDDSQYSPSPYPSNTIIIPTDILSTYLPIIDNLSTTESSPSLADNTADEAELINTKNSNNNADFADKSATEISQPKLLSISPAIRVPIFDEDITVNPIQNIVQIDTSNHFKPIFAEISITTKFVHSLSCTLVSAHTCIIANIPLPPYDNHPPPNWVNQRPIPVP